MEKESPINKDLILRERLALQRTILANQSTFLSFLRTSLYFFVAGLSITSLLNMTNSSVAIEIFFFTSSFIIFLIGILNYFKQKKMIAENEKNIGDYKNEYYGK
jgi:putative membrane protein